MYVCVVDFSGGMVASFWYKAVLTAKIKSKKKFKTLKQVTIQKYTTYFKILVHA